MTSARRHWLAAASAAALLVGCRDRNAVVWLDAPVAVSNAYSDGLLMEMLPGTGDGYEIFTAYIGADYGSIEVLRGGVPLMRASDVRLSYSVHIGLVIEADIGRTLPLDCSQVWAKLRGDFHTFGWSLSERLLTTVPCETRPGGGARLDEWIAHPLGPTANVAINCGRDDCLYLVNVWAHDMTIH